MSITHKSWALARVTSLPRMISGPFAAYPDLQRNAGCGKPPRTHAKFSQADDEHLRALIRAIGHDDWNIIGQQMNGKNVRQCKERWYNYLSPELNRSSWTAEEASLIIEKYRTLGPKWVQIVAFFPNRTDTMIKNRFNRLRRCRQKEKKIANTFDIRVLETMLRAQANKPRVPLPPEAMSQTKAESQPTESTGLGCDGYEDSFLYDDEDSLELM